MLEPADSLSGQRGGETLTLAAFAQRAYLDYAVSVVKGRALPDVADGLKPVQRRILYAMDQMGLAANARPVKSARVVGDVLGKFHPHGGHGGIRRDGADGAGLLAALSADRRAGQLRLARRRWRGGDALHGSTADADCPPGCSTNWKRARSSSVPTTTAASRNRSGCRRRLPVVLLNGASGIAVGIGDRDPVAQPHRDRRRAAAGAQGSEGFARRAARRAARAGFPRGGQIISAADDIREIYASGRGGLKARARFRFEELARGQWQLVVDELPPGTSAQKVLEEIEELTNPKVKPGKKSLTAEQQQLKQIVLAQLDTVRDESGKDAAVRLVFEPRTSKIDRDAFVTMLLAHTSLETGVPINLVMIGRDGRPRCKPLAEILTEWIDFRVDTVRREARTGWRRCRTASTSSRAGRRSCSPSTR